MVRGLRNASLTVRPVGPSDSGAVDYNSISTPTPVYLPVGQALLFGGKNPNRLAWLYMYEALLLLSLLVPICSKLHGLALRLITQYISAVYAEPQIIARNRTMTS